MIDVKVLNTSEVKELGLPKYANKGDSGMDLMSSEDLVIKAGQRGLVKTGLKIAIPNPIKISGIENGIQTIHGFVVDILEIQFEAQIRPRSGLALKKGITVLNTPGTIDEGYRNEIGVILFNTSNEDFEIKKGDRIAQIVFAPVLKASWQVVESLDETDRGQGGFGSTGV
jgi:dUTP pyrophosphatase